MKMVKVKNGLYVEDKGKTSEEELVKKWLETLEANKLSFLKNSKDDLRIKL